MPQHADVCFGPFRLDLANERLWRGAQAVSLRPKSFAVLRYLTQQPGRLVTKAELLEAVWPGTAVSESVLTVCLSELRQALGDAPHSPQFLETVPRRGYRFIGTLSRPAPGASAEGLATRPPLPGPPVVGRQAQVAQLHDWWEAAQRGARQVVFVTGEPGIGKTTVVDIFVQQATAAARLGRGQCIEHHGAGEAYLSVLDALGRLCWAPEGERLIALLHQYAPTWLVQLPWVLSAAEQTALERRVLGATRERMLREFAEAVEALTAEQPLLLVLEDLHWSDGATVDLLAWLARRREPARLLLLGTYRPVDVILGGHPLRTVQQELARQRCCVELPVEWLPAAAVAQYLAARCPGTGSQEAPLRELSQVLHRRTEGHPFFMVTLVEEWVARGVLAERAGQWELTAGVATIEEEVPDSLRQMIAQQLEGLSDDDWRRLAAASVAGSEFAAAAVAAATILRGWALAEQGQVAEGIAEMEEGLTAFRTTGAGDDVPYWLALVAEGYVRGGQAAEGRRVVSEALAVTHAQGLRVWEAELYRLQGELQLTGGAGQQTAAEACFQQALAVAQRQQAKSLELRVALSLSRLWQHQGKTTEARALLEPCYAWFTEGFDTADLQEAKAVLEELA